MAKPKIPNHRKANIDHKKRVERYAKLIQEAYDRMAQEMSRIASIAEVDPDVQFSFADYSLTRNAISRLQNQLMQEIGGIIMAGTSEEWRESNLVQDMVARKVLTAYTGTNKFGEEYTRYFQTNPDSLKAFQQRKDDGMNLASRVWNLSEQYKEELEEAISAAIAPGTSAVELAAQVKQYLKNPDKRFRRIRDKFGNLQLSENAKAYHPGRGVYRSSARNAQRLARTEINMAYRTAEQKRWEQFDFVVGYEVKTTQNGHHVEDICDQLAGKYPKDFQFKGWHPCCCCYTIPILKTEYEFWDLDEHKPSVNEVKDVPANFKEWVDDNSDRIERAEEKGSLPYFIRDNRGVVEDVLRGYSTEEAVSEEETKERERIEANRREYERLLSDPNYTDVEFNPENGGLKATHIDHEIHSGVNEQKFFKEDSESPNGLSSTDLEILCQERLYIKGYSCILESEHIFSPITGQQVTSLDTTTNGMRIDIRSITENKPNTIMNGIKAKKRQLRKFNELNGTKYNSLILYFHNSQFYNEEIVRANLGETIKRIIIVLRDGTVKEITEPLK